jgi:cytochrome bd-type quinol oxidase subunit 2
VESHIVTPIPVARARRAARVVAISSLGPLTVLAGIVWGILQPYRLTFLHPRGEGFWWLAIEPPLLVVAAGLVFWFVVARPLVADLEERDAATR